MASRESPESKSEQEDILKPDAEDSDLTKSIKTTVISYLNENYDDAATDDLLDIASLLDPRFKTCYIKEDKVNAIKARAMAEMLNEGQNNPEADSTLKSTGDEGGDATPAKKQKMTLGSFFKKPHSVTTAGLTEQEAAEAELNNYLLAPDADIGSRAAIASRAHSIGKEALNNAPACPVLLQLLFSGRKSLMSETVLGLAFLLLCTRVLQIGSSESCKLKVKMLNNTVHQILCFKKMLGDQCAIGRSTSYCNIEEKNGQTCIKWTDADMTCRKTDLSKVPLENRKCAQDQESLDCIREFTESGDAQNIATHVTTCLEGPYLMLLPLLLFFFDDV
ncbi:hypothetical protein MHYP_G00164080 [Metynnis hypsauchen]